MFPPIRPAFALAVLLCLPGLLPAADDSQPREAIARRAKAATVLVEVKPTYGTGFCVHPSGVFVTNEHVVRQGGAEPVTLVLNAGLKTQKVYKAKVLRRDKDLDLALLKAESTDRFDALTLGSDDELSELAEVIACGFPFGTTLARQGEYPTISINAGSVTSLRRDKDGELHRIQLDAALNPGNSGGPVLDRGGKVIGMVVSGIQGSGVNLAIPVSHLQRFLARPELVFTLPTVNAAHQHEAFEFTVKTVAVLPVKEPPDVELILTTGSGQERRLPMKLADGAYRVKTVPFPPREGPRVYHIEVKYEDGAVSGATEDRTFRLGDREIKLSQVRSLRLGARAEARLFDGQRTEGKPGKLEALPVKVGNQSLQLDLTHAVELIVEPPDDATAISCTIVARQGGKELGRTSQPLFIEGVSLSSLEALAQGKFVKPPRSGAPVTYMRAVSTPGDYIGQGKKYSYEANEITVQTNQRGVAVMVGGFAAWTLNFGGPGNRFLEAGEYRGAKRFPFSGDAPGIEFSGNGRGCNQISGEFVVWEIEMKGNQVVRLAIDFIQRCEEKMPPLYGSLRINSNFH